jgi:hypothetical protein
MDIEPARLLVNAQIVNLCCGSHFLHFTAADAPIHRHDPHLITFRDNLF